MSKLKEVIRSLENVSKFSFPKFEFSFPKFENDSMVDYEDIKPIIETLRELNKPVQYVVEYSYENRYVDMVFYRLNGICICVNETGHEEAKIYCHKIINESAVLVSLPPITIEQITFVEL